MKNYISDLWSKRDYDNNWQTKSANLHKQKEFENFASLVLSTFDILDKLDYKADEIEITDMWANVLKKNETHQPHTHSNNFLSGGTYYLDADETTPGISFSGPTTCRCKCDCT